MGVRCSKRNRSLNSRIFGYYLTIVVVLAKESSREPPSRPITPFRLFITASLLEFVPQSVSVNGAGRLPLFPGQYINIILEGKRYYRLCGIIDMFLDPEKTLRCLGAMICYSGAENDFVLPPNKSIGATSFPLSISVMFSVPSSTL